MWPQSFIMVWNYEFMLIMEWNWKSILKEGYGRNTKDLETDIVKKTYVQEWELMEFMNLNLPHDSSFF